MMILKKASLLATVALMFAPAAFAGGVYKEVAHDTNGHIVRNTFGNCVVTQWDSKNNECTGEKAPLELSKEQLTVYFDFNKSTLNAKEKAKLDGVAKILKGSKEVANIDIVGYADQIGKTGYNKQLSAKRAQTVKAYLSKKGVKARNVKVESFGAAHPVTNCDASLAKKDRIACLAEDRRVEIKVNLKK